MSHAASLRKPADPKVKAGVLECEFCWDPAASWVRGLPDNRWAPSRFVPVCGQHVRNCPEHSWEHFSLEEGQRLAEVDEVLSS